MDMPAEMANSDMLGLHLEAEGGIEGKNLVFGDANHSVQNSGDAAEADAASTSDQDPKEKKKKNKKIRRAERAAAEAAKKQQQPDEAQKKCTSFCGKRRALSDFNADQNSCKECVLHQKAFWRHAKSQGCEKDMKDLEKTDSKMAADVQKEFVKERMQAAALEKQLKFGIQAFRKTLESRSGERADKVRKMMWEGEWMEESKKAKHGFLGKEEAERKWQEWLSDTSVARDQEGPRGFTTRLAIPHKTILSGFNEVATKKELTQEERLSRNASDATVAARARMVVSESTKADEEALGGVKLADIKKEAVQHGVDMAEMYAPQVPHAIEAAEKKRRLSGKAKAGDKGPEADGNKEEDSNDESQASSSETDGQKHKPKGAKWFDAETKCRKAERTWMTGLDDLANSVQILLKQCAECLNDFRRKPDAATKFTEEMSILEKRQKWAAAIIEADDTSLSRHKQEQQAEEKQAMGDSQTTSQDVSALGRVGPCKDYQDLQTIAALKQMGAEFRTCTSAQQIKELNEKGATQKKPIATLLAAVKAAKSDLIAAEKRAQAQKKKEEDRAAKEAAKVAKAGAASGNAPGGEAGRARAASRSQVTRKKQSAQSILLDNNSELWQDETFRIPVLHQEELDPDLCKEPFIQSGINLPQQVSAAVAGFGKVFSGSALRVTDGRAQTTLDDENASLFITTLTKEEKVPSFWSVEALSEFASCRDALLNIQKASSFGFTACSVSSGRSELAMMPCFRLLVTGNMMVAVLTPSCLDDPRKMLEDMMSGNADSLMKRARDNELRVATLGPGDMLFLPPVCAVSHRVHAQDVLGIRVGAYSRKFNERMEQAVAEKADNATIPSAIRAILRSAMEEHADPAYSEVKMQLAAEKRAEQRHASAQVVSVPEVKASDQNGQKADSGEASTAEPMQNESKDDSGQPPQQQTENNTRETEATVPDSGSKDDAKHESPSQKDASTKADASNPDEKVKALSTAAGPPKPADKPATEDPGKKKAEKKAKAAPKVLPKVAAKAEPSEKKRKAEEVKDTGKGKGKKKRSERR